MSINREQGTQGRVQEKIGTSCPFQVGLQGQHSFSQEPCVTTRRTLCQSGGLTQALVFRVFMGVNHIGVKCPQLVCSAPRLPQRTNGCGVTRGPRQTKTGIQHKSRCLYKLCSMSQGPRYTEMLRSARMFQKLRGCHPGADSGLVLRTVGMCRVWTAQAC